jgi:hypothetical protein
VGVGKRIDEPALRALADQTGGRYVPIADWSQLLDALMQTAATLEKLTPVCFVPASCGDTEARVSVRGPDGTVVEASFAIPAD